MNSLKQRADAFESQYARQQELLFKVKARRNALVGRWAAAAMGRTDAEGYARDLASGQANEPHRLLERLRQDFEAAGVSVKDSEIEARMTELLDQATEDLYRRA
ncbi:MULTISPECIES: ATPase inhibitor subunit zeta [Alphaproteobacteria]|uniref:DUF1476 domain-containing protein n=2 Tax=Alphaproteobacteria TaxID=28211 RepID=A0A512HI93_9HYPH|nr:MULTISPECIES: ATPase inhibitor subunit zeta [Alphaproteobacteria]GEO85169.1 hypothetical protein RNA01_21010 [Ciceribacter naphthalenivorans]GLR24497.1 hypothetical protein GCM10007920_42910 [Ciceribacter naphthalenivorans]GLT07353.1 hypothetical protein GCM10007926_42910 [Sphingomonas psychrolutea]